MNFKFTKLEIPEVILIEPTYFKDERGFFAETYKKPLFIKENIPEFIQENLSKSQKNVLRGLHYQKKNSAQGKLITVFEGIIFDVAVDIRIGSPTYGKSISKKLSAKDHKLLYIPEGFAHGFCVLSDYALFSYKVTKVYNPEEERGIKWDCLGIKWPISNPILSERDKKLPELKDADIDFHY